MLFLPNVVFVCFIELDFLKTLFAQVPLIRQIHTMNFIFTKSTLDATKTTVASIVDESTAENPVEALPK